MNDVYLSLLIFGGGTALLVAGIIYALYWLCSKAVKSISKLIHR